LSHQGRKANKFTLAVRIPGGGEYYRKKKTRGEKRGENTWKTAKIAGGPEDNTEKSNTPER